MAELVLSDGTRSVDLVGVPPDGIYLVEFDPPIVARENTFAEGADSEGRERVRSQAQNATGAGRLRVDRTQDTAAEFWDDVDNLQDLVESAHRSKGTLRYVPPDGEAVTFDLQSIRLSNVPQDGRALAVRRVEPEFEFECLPFGRLDAVTLETAEVITGPLDSFEVVIPGHVNAWAELTLADTSTQNADHLEVGVDLNPTASAELMTTATLVATGFSGTSTTRAGSYGANVLRATLIASPVVVCGTGALLHIGRKKIRTRVYASADDVYVRLAYRVGDGLFTRTPWRRVPHFGAWYDVPLGVIDIDEVPAGTHSWEGRVEAYAETPGTTLDLDLLEVFPADVYAKVGSPQPIATAGVFSARDGFEQTAGVLVGKTLPVGGGNWAGAGDAADFSIDTNDDLAYRTALADVDSLAGGRFAIAPPSLTNTGVQVSCRLSSGGGGTRGRGVFARYTDINNVFVLRMFHSAGRLLYLIKLVAGVETTIAEVNLPWSGESTVWETVALVVTADGAAFGWHNAGLGITGEPVITSQDPVLATGGALASGKSGIYDHWLSSSPAETREYDNFAAWVPEVDHALHSGQSAKFQHNAFIRENSAGTRYGKLPIEGHHLRIPPSTASDLPRRVVVKRRRLNNDAGLPDLGLTDNATADLTVQPRVTLLG